MAADSVHPFPDLVDPLLRDLLHRSAEAVCAIDREQRILFINPAAERLLRGPSQVGRGEPAVGSVFCDLFPEAGRERVREYLSRAAGANATTRFELDPPAAGGARVELRSCPTAWGAALFLRELSSGAAAPADGGSSEAHGRLSFALAASNMGDWSWDADSDVVTLSGRAGEVFGIPPGPHMTWEAMRGLIHPDDREPVRLAVLRAVQQRDDYDIDYRVRRPDLGVERWVSAKGRAVYHPDGRPRGMHGVVQDVTLRKRAEEDLRRAYDALQESQRVLGNVMDNLPGMVYRCSIDAGYTFHFASPGCRDLTGYEPADFMAGGAVRYADVIHPEDLPRIRRSAEAALAAGSSFTLSYRIRTRGGELRHVLDRGRGVHAPDGALTAVEGVVIDVSAQLRAEQEARITRHRLDLVLQSSEIGLWYCDLPLNTLVWDAKVKEHFHFPPEAEITIDTFTRRLHPDDRQRTANAIDRAIRDGALYDIDYRTVCPDTGAVNWIRAIGRCYYAPDGRPLSFDGITIDVTDRKRDEEELARAKQSAEEANRAKDQFLAVLSHELRTPLTPVLMAVSALEVDGRLPGDARHDLSMVRRNIELETKLIDDLLDVTRIANGKLRLQPQPTDAHALLRNVLTILRADIHARRLRVRLDLRAADPRVSADPARLQQVFWNLVKNAIKFTASGGNISIRSDNSSPASLRIEVADDGVGIAPDVLPRIFNAFDQGDHHVTRQFGGLGLGLAISKALIDLHGGTIRAESDGPGRGARFALELPTIASPEPADGTVDSAPRAAAAPAVRVLLVEDHPDTLRMMQKLLQQMGYTVHAAGSVSAAVREIQQRDVDVLVSDIGLPDGTGLDLVRQVREVGRDIPAIAISGFGTDADLRSSQAAGFFAHLTKPVQLAQLEQTLRRAAAGRADKRANATPAQP